jgi:hypothetical protein
MNQPKPKLMSKRQEEKAIFEAFLQERPRFAGEPIKKWGQPEDEKEFPDVTCFTITGRKLGVELYRWLNESQIRHTKKIERIHNSITSALGNQGDNTTKNIYFIMLYPKSNACVKPKDRDLLRQELFHYIKEVDDRWLSEPLWHNPPAYRATPEKFSPFPILQKYLDSIMFVPRRGYTGLPTNVRPVKKTWPRGQNWIHLPPPLHGSFSFDDMFQTLINSIVRKKKHYSPIGTGFDSLYLIVYYNNLAASYNPPVEPPDAERLKSHFIEHGSYPFNQIFVFVSPGSVLTVV